MARPKKQVEEVVKNEQVVEDTVVETKVETQTKKVEDDKSKKLEEELAKKEAENKAMQEQLAQLQQMMLQMQSNQNAILASNMQNATMNTTRDTKVKIISYLYARNVFTNENGVPVADFPDTGSTVTISSRVLDSMMKPQVKELFSKGLLAFVGESEEFYDVHDIVKPQVLSFEYLKEILTLDKKECFAKLDEITNGKADAVCVTSVFWNCIKLICKEEVPHSASYMIAEYFNCRDINSKIEMAHYAKDMKFLK